MHSRRKSRSGPNFPGGDDMEAHQLPILAFAVVFVLVALGLVAMGS
jgi:hypothetical protein